MKRASSTKQHHETRPFMVWSVTDQVIENKELREAQFSDLQKAGFGGIAAWVRCSRYSWDDPLAMKACRHIITLCRQHEMSCWLGPDPRFISHKLAGDSTGLELLLFGNAARADIVPNTATVKDGRYTIRCVLSPRHVHMLTDVAVEFIPLGLARVYAFRHGTIPLGKKDIVDITSDARMFYNARDRYVEAFGTAPSYMNDEWSVIAFFRVRTNHVDFSNPLHLLKYEKMLAALKSAGCSPQGIMWDEPGYTCVYGTIPYSPWIRKAYKAKSKRSLDSEVWKMVLEPKDCSHVPVRLAYYRTVQQSISSAELRLKKTVHKLWGPKTILGIHDTWHFESADMCDMNHGSMDLWSTTEAKSGGFVDLGGIQALRDVASPHYANLAALSVIVSSLGKCALEKVAYNNLWTVGDDEGEGWQRSAMEHCVNIMALFGTRWLAHAYGPVGTIGQERTFLGSPPLPGYPDHSTWPYFSQWNDWLSSEIRNAGEALPQSNLLLLYPIETLYAFADRRADKAAADIFTLILSLLDKHFHVDVLSTPMLHAARWNNGRLCLGNQKYDFVLAPHPNVIDRRLLRLLLQVRERTAFVFSSPTLSEDGKKFAAVPANAVSALRAVELLRIVPELRPVEAPDNCWVTMTSSSQGTIVSLAPSRVGHRFAGNVTFNDQTVSLGETGQLQRILFPDKGSPKLL
jgi:hypothetical protein